MALPLVPRRVTASVADHKLQRFVWSASWLRAAEPSAAASQQLTLSQLMVCAGTAAFRTFHELYPDSRHWLVLVGAGNNGGDGYVIARAAQATGRRVTIFTMPLTRPLPPEATAAKEAWRQERQSNAASEFALNETCDAEVPSDVDLIVDGLLGTGISGPPRALYEQVINQMNQLPVPRVAIDIPSGLNAETGEVAGACIKAAHTVTFICLKPGLLTGSARDVVGTLHFNSLGLSAWMLAPERVSMSHSRRVGVEDLVHYFHTPRPATAHKGRCGKVLLVGGDHGFGGAIMMAAEAALASGAGLTRVLTRPQYIGPLLTRAPEIMVEEVPPSSSDPALESHFDRCFQWSTTIAIGPGLGVSQMGRCAVAAGLQHAEANPGKVLILDADALNVLAELLRKGNQMPSLPNSVLTPHSGEAARLLGCNIQDVERDRFTAAREIASILGGTALLKGPGTVIYSHDLCQSLGASFDECGHRCCAIIDAGNPGMAAGGMGDVLTGVLAGISAQRLHGTFDSTCASALVHGAAADVVVSEEWRGTRGVRATELVSRIPFLINPSPATTS